MSKGSIQSLILKHSQLPQVLSLATQDSDNPDLRDRGFIYWRLLSTDPGAAKEVSQADVHEKSVNLHIVYIFFIFVAIIKEYEEYK